MNVDVVVLGAIILFCAFMVSVGTFGLWFWPIGFTVNQHGRLIQKVYLNGKEVTSPAVQLFIHDAHYRVGLGRVTVYVTSESSNIQRFDGGPRTETRYGFIKLQWIGE